MDRIHNSEVNTHNLCEGHSCWSNTINFCKTHKKNLCHECTALFHYQWDLKIRNSQRFIKAATKIVAKQMDEIEEKGIEYELDREYAEYEDWVRDAKEKVTEFKRRLKDGEINEYSEDGYLQDLKKLLKDVLESQAYGKLNRTNKKYFI